MVALVRRQHEKARSILQENRAKLDEIAGYLYEKETISGEEFMRILNAVPRLPADKSGTAAGDPANAAE